MKLTPTDERVGVLTNFQPKDGKISLMDGHNFMRWNLLNFLGNIHTSIPTGQLVIISSGILNLCVYVWCLI